MNVQQRQYKMIYAKRVACVFFVHLFLVALIYTLVIMDYDPSPTAQNEAHEVWRIFFIIDFPLAYALLLPMGILLRLIDVSPSNNYHLDLAILPALYFLVVGTINWVIIWSLCTFLSKRVSLVPAQRLSDESKTTDETGAKMNGENPTEKNESE